jgi:hypothetical protein
MAFPRNIFLQLAFLIVATLAVMTPINSAQAGLFDDLWGIATDPLKIGKLADSAQRSLIQIKELEAQGNYDATARLEQMRSIITEAIAGGEDAINLAANKMDALEKQIDTDALNLIYRAQCAAEQVLMGQMQQSFAQFIKEVKEANPGYTIFGIRFGGIQLNEITVTNPDDAYITAKAAVFAKLDHDLKDNSKAYAILSTYSNLATQATYTRCFYVDQPAETKWIKEKNDLARISLPWTTIVDPQMSH